MPVNLPRIQTGFQPRSGARVQPTAQAVGGSCPSRHKPRKGRKNSQKSLSRYSLIRGETPKATPRMTMTRICFQILSTIGERARSRANLTPARTLGDSHNKKSRDLE